MSKSIERYEDAKRMLHKHLYTIIGDQQTSKAEVAELFGYDILDSIWQQSYDQINIKLQKKFDKAIDIVVSNIGTEKEWKLIVVNPSLSSEETIELTSAYEYIRLHNQGKVTDVDEHLEVDHGQKKIKDLIKRAKDALVLHTSGKELDDATALLLQELNEFGK